MPVPIADERMAREHGLTAAEFARVRELLGRDPNVIELGVFSVMWSEHCSYKSSRAVLGILPTSGPRVIQGPGENAGVMDIGDGLAVAFKIESHNHPSYVEPYQGAATGVGGIIRDVFTMGARPIASLDSLRFGSFEHPRTRYLVAGVVAGVGGYGNCVGVPTVGGETWFDRGYDENILVNAFTIGIAQSDRIFRARASGPGNPVFYVGSKTGRDGIHGASLLASAEFDEKSEEKRPTVQVGDPFTEKLLIEACLELMADDAIVAIQDMGAAGLTSSSAEMAARGGTGIELDLDRVPRRERNLTPYEILLSESQERMLLVARTGAEGRVRAVFERWGLDVVEVGRITDDGFFRVWSEGEEVVAVPVRALTEDAPRYERPASPPPDLEERRRLDPDTLEEPRDWGEVLRVLLDSPNLGSKRWIYRQYDSLVGGNTVVGPGSDGAVLRLKGTRKGLALSVDCNSRYCELDPYVGAMIAVAEAARNVTVAGAEPLGVTDCLNFGNPERPDVMWQFREAVRGLADACNAFGLPVVSGNVSFYNETRGRAIPPTPTVAMVGLLEDVAQHTTQWFKHEGDVVVLLGPSRAELGGSEYLERWHGMRAGAPPRLDLAMERAVQRACLESIRAGLVSSAHDVSEGGLAVALAECCVSSPDRQWLGCVSDTDEALPPAGWLFGESQSRILLSLPPEHLPALRRIAAAAGVPLREVGEVGGDRLRIGTLIDIPVEELYKISEGALPRRMARRPEGSAG